MRDCKRCMLLAETDELGVLQMGACSPNQRWELEQLERQVWEEAMKLRPCEECEGETWIEWLHAS